MYKKLLAALTLSLLVIAGCGSTNNEELPNNNNNGQIENENNNEQQPTNDGVNSNEERSNEESDKVGQDNNNIINYVVNGVEKSAKASPQHNDNQNYTMNVLPDYTFTAEEPNNDIVYLSEDGHIFMRIQLLDEDVDWDSIIENSKEQLKAVGDEVTQIKAPDREFFNDAIVMQTSLENEYITTYLIKNHSVPLKLMLFTEDEKDHTDPFLKMAETIVKD